MSFHIIVPVKQVPDIEKVKFDVETGRIDRSSAPGETNPFDLNALEAALQIKERYGGFITAISMGPLQAESTLKDALARGADRAILLSDSRFAGADTLATSYTLACAIKKIGSFDLIICGEKTVDGDTGQVGPELAEHLGIPHTAYVCEIRDILDGKIRVIADFGDAYYLVELDLPALITVTKDINVPRLPKLKDKLKAKKAEILIWTVDDLADVADVNRLGFAGSPTYVHKIEIPQEKIRKCQFLNGVEELAEILRQKGFLK
ncbi:MAG: electron transfer flavoprotein, beta subunit [Thermofilum sp. ex4484_82]|nr:MAG: electron transfer flavoprotein, beta subunit [Thermofilum sp. ex4484_82]OYT37717.1 MAG: electron transfer flavoprotein, beta subunit [Archaeoglobales archaeon ex4484_92]